MSEMVVIFDCDGVLALNTEDITMSVIAELINEAIGNDYGRQEGITADDLSDLVGLSGRELTTKIKEKYGVNVEESVIMETRIKKMESEPNILKKDENLVYFLEFLTENKVKFMVASSASPKPLETIIKGLNLEKYFSRDSGFNGQGSLNSVDDLQNYTNKADLYGELVKNNRGEIFIIEDSENGIKSAKKAGVDDNYIIKYRDGNNFEKIKDFFVNKIRKREIEDLSIAMEESDSLDTTDLSDFREEGVETTGRTYL